MQVFKKKVFIGSINKCSNIASVKRFMGKQNPIISSESIEEDVILVKTKEDTFVKLEELKNCALPLSLARKFVTQYKVNPEKKGDYYVTNLREYYKNETFDSTERVDLRDIVSSNRTL